MGTILDWNNLKKNKCPNCSKQFGLINFQEAGYVTCLNSLEDCNFRISEKKMMKIISSKINGEIEQQLNREYLAERNLNAEV